MGFGASTLPPPTDRDDDSDREDHRSNRHRPERPIEPLVGRYCQGGRPILRPVGILDFRGFNTGGQKLSDFGTLVVGPAARACI